MQGVVLASALGLAANTPIWADGTETLGVPSINIASGTDLIAAGVGLNEVQPGEINIDIPDGVMVKQALLYWEGRWNSPVGSPAPGLNDTILVNGIAVTGNRIGGPTPGPVPFKSVSYRADITEDIELVTGMNNLLVEGLDFDATNDGAGLLVIVDDGQGNSNIQIRDGNDYAWLRNGRPLQVQTTEPQTYMFDMADEERMAKLWLFAADVGVIDDVARPNAIDITVNGTTTRLINPLFSSDGPQWDTLMLEVPVPAGADSVTVELLSIDDNSGLSPASIAWVMGGISIVEESKCVKSKCYFKLHSKCGPLKRDPVWDLVGPKAEDTPFFKSGKTWCEMLRVRSCRGNIYKFLAREYITAKLNQLCGVNTTRIDYKLKLAERMFKHGCIDYRRAKYIAYYLYKFNKGYLGPKACKCDKPVTKRICKYKRCCSYRNCKYNKCSHYRCYKYKRCYRR